MNREEYLKFHRECCDKMISITEKKNHDYAGFGAGAFDNFTLVEKADAASTEQGFITRILDKISRINSFVKQGVCLVEDESIEDTLLDLANYSILMAGYIKSKKNMAAASDGGLKSLDGIFDGLTASQLTEIFKEYAKTESGKEAIKRAREDKRQRLILSDETGHIQKPNRPTQRDYPPFSNLYKPRKIDHT